MAITEPVATKEGLRDFLKTYYTESVLVALLISDINGDLTVNSSFSSVVGLELNQIYGYNRKILSINEPTILNEDNTIYGFVESSIIRFTATNGNIPLFTHIAIAKETSTTPKDTIGKILRIEPVDNMGVSLRNGESYDYKFEVNLSVDYE